MLINTAYLSVEEADRLRAKGYDVEIDGDSEFAKVSKPERQDDVQ